MGLKEEHVKLCQLKTVYMITPVLSTVGIIHVRLCQLKTVYMIPPVLSTIGIIPNRLHKM